MKFFVLILKKTSTDSHCPIMRFGNSMLRFLCVGAHPRVRPIAHNDERIIEGGHVYNKGGHMGPPLQGNRLPISFRPIVRLA